MIPHPFGPARAEEGAFGPNRGMCRIRVKSYHKGIAHESVYEDDVTDRRLTTLSRRNDLQLNICFCSNIEP
jgi:hypothetical protein